MASHPQTHRGVVHGRSIELDHDPGLPDGQEVMVTVQAPAAAAKQSVPGEGIRRSAGGWERRSPRLGRIYFVEPSSCASKPDGRLCLEFSARYGYLLGALKQSAANVTSKFLQYSGRLHLSVITVGELYTWAMRARAALALSRALEDFLSDVTVLDFTLSTAQRFGEVRAALLDIGRPCPDLDLIIASTALAHGLILVTHNVQDFANISGFILKTGCCPEG